MVEVDSEIERKTVVRLNLSPLIAIFHANSLLNAHKFLRAVQLLNARIHQQIDKGRGAAVHDRDFWRIHFNNDVVDAQTGQRGVQMLNR